MKNHIDDGHPPTFVQIKHRYDAGLIDHTYEPTVRVCVKMVEAHADMLDAVFDWLGSDSKQSQEAAMIVVASKAHDVYKLMYGRHP